MTPDTKNSIVITKQFSYRGATRTFSNRYHFEGALPSDPSHWATLADNIVTAEKEIYNSDVTIIQATGYDAASATATNPHGDAVFTKVYTTAGTGTWDATHERAPGDCAALIRYSTPARSTKNHPVYLFNYYHGVHMNSGGGDALATDQRAAMDTYAGLWTTGFTDGTTPRERCGPRGAVATAGATKTNITHRDFPQ